MRLALQKTLQCLYLAQACRVMQAFLVRRFHQNVQVVGSIHGTVDALVSLVKRFGWLEVLDTLILDLNAGKSEGTDDRHGCADGDDNTRGGQDAGTDPRHQSIAGALSIATGRGESLVWPWFEQTYRSG